jgi:hypothetical protein
LKNHEHFLLQLFLIVFAIAHYLTNIENFKISDPYVFHRLKGELGVADGAVDQGKFIADLYINIIKLSLKYFFICFN